MFQKLKIRNKLLIIFLIIAAFCLPLNWLILAISDKMNDRYSTIILQSFLRNQALAEIRRTAVEITRTSARITFEKGDSAQAEGTLASDQEYDTLAKLEELNQWKDDYEFHVAQSNEQSFLDIAKLKSIERALVLQTLEMITSQEDRASPNVVQTEETKLINTQKQLDNLIATSIDNEYKFWYAQLSLMQMKSLQLSNIVFSVCFADFLLIVILAFFIANKIAKPVIKLRDVVSQVTAGNYHIRAVIESDDEIGELSNDINQMIKGLINSQKLQIRLMNSEKMASLGQLAAGIAHEINTPIQYIGHNIEFLKDSFTDLIECSQSIKKAINSQLDSLPKETAHAIINEFGKVDIDYLLGEIPATIEQSMEGIAQVSKIVKTMNEFSHPGSTEKTATDLNRALDNTITVTKNVWKDIAEVKLDLDPDLPIMNCHPNEMNQVFMNLIVNAAHAIEENAKNDASKGLIEIQSRFDTHCIQIKISDTGNGIPQSIQSKIFDPFFTTKEVGKGTGQGLTIAHTIIEENHDGQLTFETELGKGTTFIIRLPLIPVNDNAKIHS